MRIHIGCELAFQLPYPTPILLMLNVHPTREADVEVKDAIVTDPAVPLEAFADMFGNRCTRLLAPAGRFAVTVDGREVDASQWGSRQARTLLKRLVLARGWPVTRDELFDLLWPDEVDRNKLGARLSVQLSHVRRVLGGGVNADRETVALDRHHVTTDLDAALSTDDDAERIELITGEFLPDDRYDDWTAPMREEVRSTLAGALRRRLDTGIGAGGGDAARLDPDACVALARRLVEVDAWDVTSHERLIAALEAVGDETGVRNARDRLADLGAD